MIANLIVDSDIYIGLGSTDTETPAFVMPVSNDESLHLSLTLPPTHIVQNLLHTTTHQATSMDWAYSQHKTAVAVVCGSHGSRESVNVAKEVLKSFIAIRGGSNSTSSNSSNKEELKSSSSSSGSGSGRGMSRSFSCGAFERVQSRDITNIKEADSGSISNGESRKPIRRISSMNSTESVLGGNGSGVRRSSNSSSSSDSEEEETLTQETKGLTITPTTTAVATTNKRFFWCTDCVVAEEGRCLWWLQSVHQHDMT